MTAPHAHRQAPDSVRAGNRRRRTKAAPAADYYPGYFTALIREQNWPPMFESRGNWSSARHAAPHVISAQSRGNAGFDAHPIGLPGAKEHTTRWEAHQAREASA